MKLTTSNVVTGNISVNKLSLGNTGLLLPEIQSLSIGNVAFTANSVTVGNVSITPSAISTPSLIIGGTYYSGGTWGGIINYQEFTANGFWLNPLIYDSSSPVSQGLTYSYYTYGGTAFNPSTESGLDALFDTDNTTRTVTFGGTGVHSTDINWGSSTQAGAGGTAGTKPAYLPGNQFAWMVEGFILAPETGTYFFGCDGDDAMDVFVNGVNVANFYGGHAFAGAWTGGSGQFSGSINLTAGQLYTFRARMQDGSVQDGFQVGWKKPSDGSIALIPASAFYYGDAVLNTSSTLTGSEQVFFMMWGGGGSGNGTDPGAGGGGGACVIGHTTLSQMSNTCAVTVGAGGTTGGTSIGGNTSFVINSSATFNAYGGSGGSGGSGSGNGGGWFSAGTNPGTGTGGDPLGGTKANPGGASTFGGAGSAADGTANGGSSVFGGSAGSGRGSGSFGGATIYGGAGGAGGSGTLRTPGTTVFGGQGGNSTVAATAPGGGAYGVNGSGARGEVRVWVMGTAGTTAGAPTYTLTANTTTLVEGSSVLYTVSTTNVANGTSLYYTLNNSSTATSADFTTAVNGSVVISGGTGTFTLTANNDTDSANEAFTIDVRTGSTTGSIVASNGSVSIIPYIQAVYNGFVFPDNTSSPTTWSAAPIGTAVTNRRVVVALYQRQAADNIQTASAVTVGGVSASLLVSRNDDARGHVDIWLATVSTGTTADIVVTWNNAGDGKLVSSYSLYGANATVYSTGSNRVVSGGTSGAISANVNVIAGGFVVAMAGADAPGGGQTTTFTTGVDVDNTGSTLGKGAVGWGSKAITATQTDYTVTATTTDTADRLLAIASFQPG